MTKLYINILCTHCDRQIGVQTGANFGSQVGDKDVKDGLCLKCSYENWVREGIE